jgi:hypothetical protein
MQDFPESTDESYRVLASSDLQRVIEDSGSPEVKFSIAGK